MVIRVCSIFNAILTFTCIFILGCAPPPPPYTSALPSPDGQSKPLEQNERARRLKEAYDQGLILESEYTERLDRLMGEERVVVWQGVLANRFNSLGHGVGIYFGYSFNDGEFLWIYVDENQAQEGRMMVSAGPVRRAVSLRFEPQGRYQFTSNGVRFELAWKGNNVRLMRIPRSGANEPGT